MLFKQRDQRLVFTKRQRQNLEMLDIIESVYQFIDVIAII